MPPSLSKSRPKIIYAPHTTCSSHHGLKEPNTKFGSLRLDKQSRARVSKRRGSGPSSVPFACPPQACAKEGPIPYSAFEFALATPRESDGGCLNIFS